MKNNLNRKALNSKKIPRAVFKKETQRQKIIKTKIKTKRVLLVNNLRVN